MKIMFDPINNYYEEIFVITIEAAVERRKLFSERFKGLDFNFFYGADKSKFTVEELKEKNIYNEEMAIKTHRYSKTMKPGEVACAWSHRMLYEKMIDRQIEKILIMEDDAVPDPAQLEKISLILAEIPGDCEVLMWGWGKNGESDIGTLLKQSSYKIQHLLGLLKWSPVMIKNLHAKKFSTHLKKAGFHDYTYAYALTLSGAKKLLSLQTPIHYIADNLLAYAITNEIVNGYIVYPPVFLHDSLPDGTARDSYIR